MAKKTVNNIKLGSFVLAGLLFLVLLLYMIGKNQSLFGDTFLLRANFENVQGLVAGNNVRFSGIQVGTVKNITIRSDTVIEVTMMIEKKMRSIIRKNAIISIGTDGLVGNKVVNIIPARAAAAFAEEGDLLPTKKAVHTDDMLQTLNKANNDIAIIAAELKTTIQQINNSSAFWSLLNDDGLPKNVRYAVSNIRYATGKASAMVDNLHAVVANVQNGKGSLGALLTDTSFATNLNEAVVKFKNVGENADKLAGEINEMIASLQADLQTGQGTLHALLKDSAMVNRLNESLENIQNGTNSFNQNMEALKHSFLLRGYFKKQAKKQLRAASKEVDN